MLPSSHATLPAICGAAGRHQFQFVFAAPWSEWGWTVTSRRLSGVVSVLLNTFMNTAAWEDRAKMRMRSFAISWTSSQGRKLDRIYYQNTFFASMSHFNFPFLLRDEWAPHLRSSTPTYFVFLAGSLFSPPPPLLVLLFWYNQGFNYIFSSHICLPDLTFHSFSRTAIAEAHQTWSVLTQSTQITWAGWWNASQLSVQNDEYGLHSLWACLYTWMIQIRVGQEPRGPPQCPKQPWL